MNKPPLVLIVDDSVALLDVYSDIISSAGFKVMVAETGIIAMDLAKRARPDLILLDIMMPCMDGDAVEASLKSDPATADIPVLFMSSVLSENEQREKFAAAGRNVNFMAKALAPHDLINSVRGSLGIK